MSEKKDTAGSASQQEVLTTAEEILKSYLSAFRELAK